MNTTDPTPPSGHPPAPDPDTTIRLDPAAEAEEFGLSLDEVDPAEDSAGWALHWWARLTFSDDFTDALGDGRGLHYTLSTADHLPNCVIKTVTPEQVRAFGASLIELADRAAARRAPAPSVPDLAEVALGALAAAGRGETDGEVLVEAEEHGSTPTLEWYALEIADGTGISPADARSALAVLEEMGVDPRVAQVRLDRLLALDEQHRLLERQLAEARDVAAPPAMCGDTSGSWHEVCLLPAGHKGWHKALAATWAPGIPAVQEQGDDTEVAP